MSSYQKPLSSKTNGLLVSAVDRQIPAGLPLFVRSVWALYMALILAYMVAGLPLVLAQNQLPCEGTGCLDWQLPVAGLEQLGKAGISLVQYGWYSTLVPLIVPLLALALVTVVIWKRPTDRMVWLFALALGTCPVNLSMSTLALAGAYPILRFPAQLIEFCFSSLFAFIALFPNGRFVPRWSIGLVILNVPLFGIPIFFPSTGAPGTLTASIFGVWQAVSAFLMLAILVYRYRWVADQKQRQQIKLLAFGLIIPSVISIGTGLLARIAQIDLQPGTVGSIIQRTMAIAGIAFFILCLWVAVYRYQMFDIDLILNRTLVYTTLTAAVVGLYILLVSGLGALLKARESFLASLAATGVIAVLFQPLHGWLQRGVNRLFYGRRDEPYQVLAQLGSRLVTARGTEDILPTIVETIRETLNLPYVAIRLPANSSSSPEQVSSGNACALPSTIPISYQGVLVGQLITCPRSGEESMNAADERLLGDFARQAGIAIHAVQLAQELQRSREQIVTAREEERRRLRRDLHDGLGPALATISMQSETARGLLRDHPEQADELLAELTGQAQTTMQEVRRLIHALRPPVLDDLGLVPALNALAASYSQSGLSISIQADGDAPEMPAAYEVALYRIAQEALTNVTRHARAKTCTVLLTWDKTICLEIVDDGVGIPANRVSGVGLNSMRERAEELGGSFYVTTNQEKGTRVQAIIPIRSSHGTD